MGSTPSAGETTSIRSRTDGVIVRIEPFTLRNFAVAKAQALVAGIATSNRNIQARTYICATKGRVFMWKERDDQERPCLHCKMIELIDEFYAEYPATTGEPDEAYPVVSGLSRCSSWVRTADLRGLSRWMMSQ